ncbi:urea ABC transporter substrate-binding protein [Pseudoclavibacter endophyticus]|nr:urea ABC transporter substrate-binding protein [Pseudoclavibacter endophyticus]
MTASLAACGSSIGPAAEGGDSGALKVGVVVPATGVTSSAGLALQAGVEIAIETINDEGGVNGQPIEYEVEDDRGDPATTTQIANRLASDPDISLMVGTITGDTAQAAASVADAEGLPFATAILGDPSVCSDYAWSFGESIRQMLEPLVPELLEKYGTRVALVGSDYVFPRDYSAAAREIVADAGGEIVAEEYSPMGTTDFESTIGRLAAGEPDVILSMVVGADAIAFTQQAAAFGLLTPEIGFEGAPTDADYYPALTTLVEGREKAVRWTDAFDDPESQAFVEAYRERTGSDAPIPEVAANAYFAMRFIAAAANDAGVTDREGINEAIGSFSYDSPLGDGTHFDGDRNILQANIFTAMIQPGGVYEIVEDHGIIPDTGAPC